VTDNIVEFPDRSIVQEEAAYWLIKLDADGTLPPALQIAFEEWLSRSLLHRQELHRLAALWQRMNVLTELAVPLDQPRDSRMQGLRNFFLHWVAASERALGLAVCMVAIAITAVLLISGAVAGHREYSAVYVTRVGEQQQVKLRDGSVIRVNTNSEVHVHFSQSYRDVRLKRGEAEFTVAKDAQRPFRVYAGNERVQAIGTAFTVYLQDNRIDVSVTEGQVALARRATDDPLSVTPETSAVPLSTVVTDPYVETLSALKAGQSARVNVDTENETRLSAVAVEVFEQAEVMERRLAWRSGLLIFEGDPLENVVREISRYTTLAIEIADPEVAATKIGGQFPLGETEAMLYVLETSFGFTVTRVDDDRVVISKAAN
jgi:transmembrane sensor